MLKGSAASVEHKSVLDNMECRTVVDIGANRGQFALAARNYFPEAQVFSFEPLQEPAAIFKKVFISDANVKLHECAIGPHEEETVIHVSNADDSSSLLPISSLQTNLFPGTGEKETRTIQVKPLDAFINIADIKTPALLKMDVQGFELQALEGCRSLLPSFSYIYVECSFVELYSGQSLAHEVIGFLKECDFILCGVYNLSYEKKVLPFKAIFCSRKKNLRIDDCASYFMGLIFLPN